MRVALLALAGLLAAAPAASAAKLRAFASCPQLLDYARDHGETAVSTGWVPGPLPVDVAVAPAGRPVGGTQTTTAPAVAEGVREDSASAGTDFSTTNVQEQGVDEPDLVKTDGKTLFAVVNGWIHSFDVTGDEPKLLDAERLDEGYGHELLMRGDRLLVIQTAYVSNAERPYGWAVTRMTQIDASDPANLRIVARERNDGSYVTARLTGDTARIVLATRAEVIYDIAAATGRGQKALIAKRERLARRAHLRAWRPYTLFERKVKPRRALFRPITPCDDVRRSIRFSGLDSTTILTVDMSRGLPSVDADSVLSDAQIVYASPGRLYVATQKWLSPDVMARATAPETRTEIHVFDTTDANTTRYVTSGTVAGYLLNQFALSEYDGVLRVASTESPQWWPRGRGDDPGSAVATFDAGSMAPLGRVGGLGKGERIYAVRFLGDRGYVVTFRQVDPLYVVDLSAPSEPKVTGELKIAGYSAYLHPIGGDLLLGLGQDATKEGLTTGTQLSLFDVSDPAKPTRVAQTALAGGSSSAEYDHKAFLYWPKTKLAVIPVAAYGEGEPFVGAIGFRVQRDGIAEVGRVEHPALDSSYWDVQRATVVGERLLTLSYAGVMSSPLATLGNGPFVELPSRPVYTGGCYGPPVESSSSDTAAGCPVFAAR